MEDCKITLSPQTPETAAPEAKPLLQSAQEKMGMIPNMYARMANSPGLLATYLQGYDLFRNQSAFTPAEQEVVFLSISFENGCSYCMAAHSWVADTMSKVPPEVTKALRAGAPIPDRRLAALSQFTKIMVQKRGRPSQQDAEAFLQAGFTERQILDIVLAIGVKTLSNYTNHLFHTPVDKVFSTHEWTAPQACALTA